MNHLLTLSETALGKTDTINLSCVETQELEGFSGRQIEKPNGFRPVYFT
jgi:hypothetical protein